MVSSFQYMLDQNDQRFREIQDNMIEAHEHSITVYYHDTVSGTNVSYDSYYGEGIDPNDPTSYSGITVSSGDTQTITGILYHNQGSLSLNESIKYSPIGRFEPGTVVFTCRISDTVVDGVNYLEDANYVVISTDSEKYRIQYWDRAGLKNPYVFHVILHKTNQ